MKYIAIAGLAILLTLAMPGGASAGDFHFGLGLKCPQCHNMHYSQTKGYTPVGSDITTPLGPGGPFPYLLRNEINDLCLSCHDAQNFAPDVLEDHGNGYVRQAGGLNRVGGTRQEHTGHTLDSLDNAPGSDPAWNNPDGLNCVNCHAAHGAGLGGCFAEPQGCFRNLGGYGTEPGPAAGISYTRGDVEGANPLTAWVHETASSGVSGTHYGYGNITFNEPVTTESAYADFCKGCHTNFHGAVPGAELGGEASGAGWEHFLRHPTNTVNIGTLGGGHTGSQLYGHTRQVQVMSPTGQTAGSGTGYDGTDTGLTPSCMSCHKAHGNENAFALLFMRGNGAAVDENGDGTLGPGSGVDGVRALCKQCHGQGGDPYATP